jgi:uncharacterized protein
MRSVFINLPVADTVTSKAFYAALGFQHNPAFTDEQTTCIAISEHIYVMAMDRSRFQGFITGEIAPGPPTPTVPGAPVSCSRRSTRSRTAARERS